MKKLLLFLALCGTGSFVVSMDGDGMAEMDGNEDNGSSGDNLSNDGRNTDRTEEEQMLDGHQTSTDSRPQRRTVRWGDGEETGQLDPDPTNDQDTAQDGAAAFDDAGQGTEAEIEQANRANAENLERGLELAPDRHQQIDGNDESGFWGNQSEDDRGVARRAVESGTNDAVIQKLFGEQDLGTGETKEGMLKKLKRREQIERARREKSTGLTGNRQSLETVRSIDEINYDDNREEREASQQLREKRLGKLDEIIREYPSLLSDADKRQLEKDIENGSHVDSLRHFLGEFDSDMNTENRLGQYRNDQESGGDQEDINDLGEKVSFSSELDMLERTPKEIEAKIKSIQNNIFKVTKDIEMIDAKGRKLVQDKQLENGDWTYKRRLAEDQVESMKEGYREGIEKLRNTQEYLRDILKMSPQEKVDEVARKINEQLDTKISEFKNDRADNLDIQTELGRLGRTKKIIESYKEKLESTYSHTMREEIVLKRTDQFLDDINIRRHELFDDRINKLSEEAHSSDLTPEKYDGLESNLKSIRKKVQERINELREPDNDAERIEKQQLENQLKVIDSQREYLLNRLADQLNSEVNEFKSNLGEKNPTHQECEEYYNKINEVYRQVDTEISKLNQQAVKLGFRTKEVKSKSWFLGKTKTTIEPDYSGVTDREALNTLQERKQSLEELQRKLTATYRRVEEVDPDQYTLNRWNRLSSSDRSKLNRQDLELYRQGIERAQDEQPPKRKWWQRKAQTQNDATAEIQRHFNNNPPDRYSTDDWNSLSSQGRRNLSDDQLRSYADEIDSYGKALREGFTPEDRRRIKNTLRAREQLRQESNRRGRLLFKPNVAAA